MEQRDATRRAILGRIAEALGARADVIAHKIAIDVGTPLKLSRARAIQTELIGSFRTAERIIGEFPFERRIGNSQVLMEPVGESCVSRLGTTRSIRSQPRSRCVWPSAARSC
ncbi:MAG: hypothetical protein ACRD1G_05965 [Acidimicrobiales bacterium]